MLIRLVGPPHILAEDGSVRRLRGHKTWALLARILLSETPLSRRTLAMELFADTADPLGSVRWALAEIRRAIGVEGILSGDPIETNFTDRVAVDTDLLADRAVDDDLVASLAMGSLLEGVDPDAGPEFDAWLLVARERTAAKIRSLVRERAVHSLAMGETERAVELGRMAVAANAYDESAHILLVKALAANGDADAAERHIRTVEDLFTAELGTAPTAALRDAARPAVAAAAPGVPAVARSRSMLEAGHACLDAGATSVGLECLRRAVEDAEEAGDRHLEGETLFALGAALVHSVRGYDDEGAMLLDRAAERGLEVGDPALVANSRRELGYIDALAGRRSAANRHLRAALEAADADDALRGGVLAVDGFNLVDWGRQTTGLARLAEAEELLESSGLFRRLAWTLAVDATARLRECDIENAQRAADRSFAIATEERLTSFRPWPTAIRAEIGLLCGEDAASIRESLEQSYALSCQLDDPCWEGASSRVLALTLDALGAREEAREWLALARIRCRRLPDVYVALEAAILVSEVELSLADEDLRHAEATARSLISLAARTEMDGFLTVGTRLLDRTRLGNPPGAARTAS